MTSRRHGFRAFGMRRSRRRGSGRSSAPRLSLLAYSSFWLSLPATEFWSFPFAGLTRQVLRQPSRYCAATKSTSTSPGRGGVMRYLSRWWGAARMEEDMRRSGWQPEASMTWSDRMRFHQGDLSHRDASFPIAPAAGRPVRGRLIGHSLVGRTCRMEKGACCSTLPKPSRRSVRHAWPAASRILMNLDYLLHQRLRGWEPMRSRAMGSSRDVSPAMASPRLPVEDWQHKLHAAFPRVSGQVKPKAAYAMRSAARWQERLGGARRDAQILRGARRRYPCGCQAVMANKHARERVLECEPRVLARQLGRGLRFCVCRVYQPCNCI